MKEVKAYIHHGRVAAIVRALEAAGFRQLSVLDVKGMLRALSEREQEYSIELGVKVTHEIRLELVCEDGDVDRAVQLIRHHGRTGQRVAGWVYVSPIEQAWPIERDANDCAHPEQPQ